MGVNIHAHILKERGISMGYVYWDTDRFEGFSTLGHAGDREFVSTSEIEWHEEPDDPNQPFGTEGESYIRPKNIDNAISWVIRSVHECNQLRLVRLLEDMRKNERLFICVSQ